MDQFLVFVGVGVLLFCGLLLGSLNRNRGKRPYKYRKSKYLLTKAELSFFGCLQAAVGSDRQVNCKVRMADLMDVAETDKARRLGALTRITQKHVDFVIADRSTSEIHCVIELDDKSHKSRSRQDRDAFVNNAFETAGIRLVRVPAKASYKIQELRLLVDPIKVETNEIRRAS